MKTKEELIRIYSAYLLSGLKFSTPEGIKSMVAIITFPELMIGFADNKEERKYYYPKDLKPLFWDLSYLTIEIEHEEKMITPSKEILKHIGVPGDYFEIKEGYVLIRRNGMVKHKIIWAGELADDCMVWVYQKLIEWHFNVFNLPEGEYINKEKLNDVEPYSVEWSDIEKAEIEYENYLNDVEIFFTDFESDDETKFNPGVI